LKKHNTSGLSHNNIIQSFKEIKELETFFRVIINNNKLYDFSLEDGKMFGEEYLFNYIKYSNCIIECETECIIGELDKEDYEKIFRKVNVIERSNVTGFIVNLKIFNSSNFFLPKLQRCLIKRYFAKNEIIFNQNDPFRAFYVIRKGKINLSLKISKKVNCDLEPEIIMGNKKNKRFTSSSAFVVKGEYLESNEYNLVTVEEGEFIGEVEYYKKKDKYMYTAQCVEDCLLFKFDLYLFEHLIKENKKINSNLKGFIEKIKEKMDLLQDRIYTTKTSSSAIKKSDYVLSKNKFTQNLLQNNPLKEEKKKSKFH
jgi:CRP-like cAMP-binding protein